MMPVKKLDPIARLEFSDVSSESGVSVDQIAKLVLEQVLKSVLEKQGMKNTIQKVIPNGMLDNFPSPF